MKTPGTEYCVLYSSTNPVKFSEVWNLLESHSREHGTNIMLGYRTTYQYSNRVPLDDPKGFTIILCAKSDWRNLREHLNKKGYA